MHGWLGLLVVSLQSANYVGDWFVWSSYVSPATKKTFVPMHQFLGLFTFAMACFQVRAAARSCALVAFSLSVRVCRQRSGPQSHLCA